MYIGKTDSGSMAVFLNLRASGVSHEVLSDAIDLAVCAYPKASNFGFEFVGDSCAVTFSSGVDCQSQIFPTATQPSLF